MKKTGSHTAVLWATGLVLRNDLFTYTLHYIYWNAKAANDDKWTTFIFVGNQEMTSCGQVH